MDFVVEVASAHLAAADVQAIVGEMLLHRVAAVRQSALKILAAQPGNVSSAAWLVPLAQLLEQAVTRRDGAELMPLLEAIGKLRAKHFDPTLERIMMDPQWPAPLRLRALSGLSRPDEPLAPRSFSHLVEFATTDGSATARVDAVRFLCRARLSKAQLIEMTPVFATVGAVELLELLRVARRFDAATVRAWARSVVKSPLITSLEESSLRWGFSALGAQEYEEILGPIVRAAARVSDAKKQKLETFSASAANGRVAEGRKVFEQSACITCHKAGDVGRPMGPDLNRIGQIRKPRDILESILSPRATIARDFATHLVETADGQIYSGAIKNNSGDALTLIDLAGQETAIPHSRIVGRTVQATSLMPSGLEQAFTDQQLLDLVAWLVALK